MIKLCHDCYTVCHTAYVVLISLNYNPFSRVYSGCLVWGDAAEKARAEALWRSRNLSMSCYHEDKLLVRFSIYFFGKINFDELICVQN